MLRVATEEPESVQQAHAEATMVNLLSNDSTAAAVLQRPGAVMRLLHCAATSSDCQALIRALLTALPVAHSQKAVTADDIEGLLEFLQSEHTMELKHVAASYLASWAESSVVNSRRIASSGSVNAICHVVRQVTGKGRESHLLQCEVARIMGALGAHCASSMEQWVNPLVFMLADGAATSDPSLAHAVVNALATCAATGDPSVQKALANSTLWPLLHTIAKEGCGQLKCAAIPVVGALASGGIPVCESEADYWTETLLGWVTGNESEDCLVATSTAALAGKEWLIC
ncbi:unnamed protein product [Ostreobium quekettii]|uniref:Uncharacterized protein n=1 Tax=Ostreobium quekettii TaxID=121088 RepID=A0A8S1IPU3_9CHLO|nr:unnamed protein product [Ostreobium quekettii]